jgi:ABC-type sugar transport system ATPase subunit
VILGLRPEHLAPGTENGAGLPLEVALVEMLGADAVVHGQLSARGAPLTARLDGTNQVARGDRLRLMVEPRHLHLFDPLNGRRIEA